MARDQVTLSFREIGSRKERTLVKLLLVERGHLVPSDRIAEALWNGAPPLALASLVLLHRGCCRTCSTSRLGNVVGFDGTLESTLRGGGGCLVELPADVLRELGGGSRLRVKGTLDGVAFGSSTMPLGGGRVCLGVHKATREAAGKTFGDRVHIELERDDAPREVDVPDELAQALSKDRIAREVYEGLSFTHRNEYARWVAEAKKPETKERRIQQTLEMLRAGVKTPRA